MGQFSWIYSDTNRQLRDDVYKDTYLLVPEKFQRKYGKAIYEECYDGFGHFGNYDVYELIPEWNKEMIPEIISRVNCGKWYCPVDNEILENLQAYYEGKEITCRLRSLGICMACYDEDNFALKYPIKITTQIMDYKDAKPSKSDPEQGW